LGRHGSWPWNNLSDCVPCRWLFWLWQLGRRIGAQTVNSNMLADLEKRVKKVKRELGGAINWRGWRIADSQYGIFFMLLAGRGEEMKPHWGLRKEDGVDGYRGKRSGKRSGEEGVSIRIVGR